VSADASPRKASSATALGGVKEHAVANVTAHMGISTLAGDTSRIP
jgi:hypothetical protein